MYTHIILSMLTGLTSGGGVIVEVHCGHNDTIATKINVMRHAECLLLERSDPTNRQYFNDKNFRVIMRITSLKIYHRHADTGEKY